MQHTHHFSPFYIYWKNCTRADIKPLDFSQSLVTVTLENRTESTRPHTPEMRFTVQLCRCTALVSWVTFCIDPAEIHSQHQLVLQYRLGLPTLACLQWFTSGLVRGSFFKLYGELFGGNLSHWTTFCHSYILNLNVNLRTFFTYSNDFHCFPVLRNKRASNCILYNTTVQLAVTEESPKNSLSCLLWKTR